MIEFSFRKLPVDAAGKAYDSLEDFQKAQIAKVLNLPEGPEYERIAFSIVNKKNDVIELLELTMDARPKARGVPKKRKPKADAQIKVA